MEAYVETLCLLAQRGKQPISKQKRIRTARKSNWNSDNQGVQEETFIQTGRRGRDRQPGWRGLMARQQRADQVGEQWLADQAVPHLHVGKPGGTTGE